jgi:uncharacterized heparinase superfamily protein
MGRLTSLLYASPLYRYTLRRGPGTALLGQPPGLWPGNPEPGKSILDGRLHLAGQGWEFGGFEDMPGDAGAAWLTQAHGFSWLRHLKALDSAPARDLARHMAGSWISAHDRWSPLAWRPDVLAERLINWFTHFAFIAGDEDEILASASAQARHLARAQVGMDRDARLLRALKGLIYCGVCLAGHDRLLDTGLGLMERETEHQILPDGGHIERSPTLQADLFRDYLDLRAALSAAHREPPDWMEGTIERMAPLLRGFRHGDGGLALFNDSFEGDASYIDAVLAEGGVKGKPLSSAPHTGYHRLSAAGTLIIADVGRPAPPGADRHAHASTLAFEMSVGKERLVVNCGARADEDWRTALRSTAAHSTLAVDDVNSSDVISGKGLGRRPDEVICSRRESDGSLFLEASHDGYRRPFGLVHKRLLYLSADGEDVRGEDSLVGSGGRRFALRFHLHPRVQASMVRGETEVLLRLPGGAGWRFRAEGGDTSLERSVYVGDDRNVNRSRQIVVAGDLNGRGAELKWRLSREKA